MAKPCESWGTWVEALNKGNLVSAAHPNFHNAKVIVTIRVTHENSARCAKKLGLIGSSLTDVKSVLATRGASFEVSRTGFSATFQKNTFVPC